MPATTEKTNYLTTLLRLGQTLNSSLDLNEVLNTAIREVVAFVCAERGFIILVDQGTNKVWGKAAHNIDLTALESVLAGRDPSNKPEVSRGIVEQVLRERKAVLSTNAMEDPRFQSHTSVQLAHVRSVLCVPLVAQGHVLGIVYLDNRVRASVFAESDEEMLSAFANQAAVAIQNARLYENLRGSLEERLKLQEELHAKERERTALHEASRLKSEFIDYVSHELRNPLTTIRGYVQTLSGANGEISADMRTEFYETIEAESDRMLGLINELLDSSRLEADRPLSLNARCVQLAPILRRLAGSHKFYKFWTEQHTLILDIPDTLPEIEADEDKVHQVVANLLSNAIKYSPQGGEILLAASAESGGVRITVADHGVGLCPEDAARLFNRYERAERADIERIPGTGLGLYLTKHLVELHGGSITCESAPGEGSRFSVFLPQRPVSAAAA